MYVARSIRPVFEKALKQFPAVLVTGPRQSGKTTFARHAAAKAAYLSLDDPLERAFASEDPNGFLDRFKNQPLVLDEIQYAPELLPYLKLRIDQARKRHGRFILTGSQQFQLMRNVSESLAGRIAILELLPFRRPEYSGSDKKNLATTLWQSNYPEPALFPEKRELWATSYLQTYIERDVRQLLDIGNLRLFETFLALAAARHGQEWNMADLSRQCGVSQPTVKSWASVLEASYLACFLPPYFRNFGKRLIKAPKFYFLDNALAATLTRQPGAEAALAGPMGGALFEGWVVSEAVKAFAARGEKPGLFFWRSHDGLEVDLLVQAQGKLWPVEIKLTATPTPQHLRPMEKFIALAGAEAGSPGLLVCQVPKSRALPGGHLAIPWHDFPKWLDDLLAG
ncbi:MAG: ATP-binding protein [Thermodesulfobacteriota bacterium]|jgi:predicted AAA+ superfamily ATPase